MDSPDWLEHAVEEVSVDKNTHIPYLIIDSELVQKESGSIIDELIQHPGIKKILEELGSNNPNSIENSTIITANLEVRPSQVQKDEHPFDDHTIVSGYFVDISPNNLRAKIRIYRGAEQGREAHIEVVNIIDCTSPTGATITKTEYFNHKGEKISDHYRLQFDKNIVDREDAIDQLSSDFYLRIISEEKNTITSPTHPKGTLIEVGFTSDTNGDGPMVVVNSTENDQYKFTVQPNNISSSVTDHPQLLAYYAEIASRFTEIILGKKVTVSLPELPSR